MMLQALVAYADRVGLGDVDFQKRPVDYQLVLRNDGTFLGFVALGSGKTRAELDGLPIGPPAKNNPGYPNFIVDNATYVLGIAKDGGDPAKKQENAEKCRVSFRDLVNKAHREMPDDGLSALHHFLNNDEEMRRADAALEKIDPKPAGRGERILVPILESDGSNIHARPNVRRWWTESRNKERAQSAEGAQERCLVTGVVGPIARIHPSLNTHPFPGTGAKLVAYDKEPFSSHYLDQGANAPVSELAALKYVAALKHLIEKDGDRRRSAVQLDPETLVVFWTREDSDAPKFLLSLFDAPPKAQEGAESLLSIWRGTRPTAFDPTPFYAMTISPNAARIVIRDWFETTAVDLKRNLHAWFVDLHLGDGEVEPMPLLRMLRALQATPDASSDKRGLPPNLATRVFRSAVQGFPLPISLLHAALARLRVPPKKVEDARFVLRARVSIIKAVLIRQGKEIPVALDEKNNDVPYLLGRLFAALEVLQGRALGDINATIRDRYFGAASANPATVFPRLLRVSVHHAAKVDGNYLEKLKSSIIDKLPAQAFPAVMNLEQQGLFAVGYYHQREALFRKAPQTDKTVTNSESAS